MARGDDRPPDRFGDYVLVRKIASGGMAEIHLARARSTHGADKFVAIKAIHPRYLEDKSFHRMLVEEARLAVQLSHKNIGQVFDLGQVDGRYFIVMEYIDGFDLSRAHDACREKGTKLPADVAAFIGREVCAALAFAHTRRDRTGRPLNLIHRDISPQNILLSFNGEVKIIDFGIAKVSTSVQQTHAGIIKGKFYYMSPEQAGAGEVDQRTDLFSLGICLWETLCGRSLFRREGGPSNPLAILHEIRTMPIPRVREFRRDCPQALDDIVARALARDLSRRFSSAAEMQGALNRALIEMAPSFSHRRLADAMTQLYGKADGKTESPRDGGRVSQAAPEVMTHNEFQPSDASMIFDVDGAFRAGDGFDPVSATAILADDGSLPVIAPVVAARSPEPAVPRPPSMGLQRGPATPSPRSAPPARTPTVAPVPARPVVATADEADETIFFRKDAPAPPPQRVQTPVRALSTPPRPDAPTAELPTEGNPNVETQALSREAIDSASRAYLGDAADEARGRFGRDGPAEVTPIPELPLASHPLFRWLVLSVLVLLILVATLVLMLVRRTATSPTPPAAAQLVTTRTAPACGTSTVKSPTTTLKLPFDVSSMT